MNDIENYLSNNPSDDIAKDLLNIIPHFKSIYNSLKIILGEKKEIVLKEILKNLKLNKNWFILKLSICNYIRSVDIL